MDGDDLGHFVSWFQSHANGGYIDTSVIGITTFPDNGGRGAIALIDIPEGHTLFTIPRSLTLSTRTSPVPAILGDAKWKKFELDKGWVGLILCMMWEEAQGAASKWAQYMAGLPTAFDTPMFWSADELEELKGTSVVDKIGRQDAERDYYKKLLPAIRSRQDLFSPNLISRFYSLEKYHIHGSRILSRSFQVSKWGGEEEITDTVHVQANDIEIADSGNTSTESKMDVDEDTSAYPLHADASQSEDSEDGDEDDPSDIAMVPMADMLNARYGSENSKLFHEEKVLRMVTTKFIKAGEQIWNTYGDLPNSDLLRRYGHVDILPLPWGGEGNPADVVEVRADIVVAIITQDFNFSTELKERIDWWLEQGGDDAFVLETDLQLPQSLVSFTRLLLLPDGEWTKTRDKGKIPKPKIDSQALSVILKVLRKRLDEYPTTMEFDANILCENLQLNKRHAIIVRLGEKKILVRQMEKLQTMEQAFRVGVITNKRKKQNGGEPVEAEDGGMKRAKK